VVLLEVVIALSFFFGAAVVVLIGLHSSIIAARNLRLEARGADLAVSLLSELQMGQLAIEDAGPDAYDSQEDESLADWTWQVVTTDLAEDDIQLQTAQTMKRVEIIITNTRQGFTYNLVHLFPSEGGTAGAAEEPVPVDETGGFP